MIDIIFYTGLIFFVVKVILLSPVITYWAAWILGILLIIWAFISLAKR